MCVIAFAPRGVDIPTEEQLKQMWRSNPDGAGYAYVGKRGKVYYKKGFMTLDSLLEDLKGKREQFRRTNFAIHFRIGTSGKNDAKTCHPFPVSADFRDLTKTSGVVESVLFHNGIIGEGGMVNKLASDTQDFVVAMSPLLRKYNKSSTRDYFMEQLVEGNRILVLYEKNRVKMYGKWERDGELYVSNTLYKQHYEYEKYFYGSAGGWWDDWYAEREAEKQVARLTRTEHVERSENAKQEAERLYAKILQNTYAYVTMGQINLMEEYADAVSGDMLEYGGFLFGVDAEQGVAWVEEN